MLDQLKVSSVVPVLTGLLLLVASGCALNDAGDSSNALSVGLPEVGSYPAPSRAIAMAEQKPPLVVAPLAVEADTAGPALGEQAAAELYDLLEQTERFDLSHRESFVLSATSSSDTTDKAAQAAAVAKAAGAAYVAVGRITELTVHPETRENWLRSTWGRVTGEAFDPTDSSSLVRVVAEVELQILDAASAQPRERTTARFAHTAPADAMQLELEGYADPEVGGRLSISADSQRQLVRYALDKALRQMLPNLDQMVLAWTFEHDF